MASDIAGIILAGGLSRRMGGGDKPLRPLADRSLLDHVATRLAPQVGALAINANGDPARFPAFGLSVISDTVEGFAGPLAGILAGLEWAASETTAKRVVSVAGDTPFFPWDLVSRLLEATAGKSDIIAVAASGGRTHPTFALWPVDLAAALRAALVEAGERRVTAFIARHPHVEVDFAFPQVAGLDYDPFFNINTPQDLAEAERLAQIINRRS
jgi:molybdopterin-guanine dinucleotide biosynthesis protein A